MNRRTEVGDPMSALPQPKPYLTPEEYLALERQAETKSEYWQGETYVLAGACRQHNLVAANLTAALNCNSGAVHVKSMRAICV